MKIKNLKLKTKSLKLNMKIESSLNNKIPKSTTTDGLKNEGWPSTTFTMELSENRI